MVYSTSHLAFSFCLFVFLLFVISLMIVLSMHIVMIFCKNRQRTEYRAERERQRKAESEMKGAEIKEQNDDDNAEN